MSRAFDVGFPACHKSVLDKRFCVERTGTCSAMNVTIHQENAMKHPALAMALSGLLVLTTVGCAVSRQQSTVGEYVDDATITARVKAKFAEDREVSALAISVETLRGSVQLSGFAKSATEKSRAEGIARTTPGVASVINNIVVRP